MVTEALSLLFMILVNLTSVGGDGTKVQQCLNSYNYLLTLRTHEVSVIPVRHALRDLLVASPFLKSYI